MNATNHLGVLLEERKDCFTKTHSPALGIDVYRVVHENQCTFNAHHLYECPFCKDDVLFLDGINNDTWVLLRKKDGGYLACIFWEDGDNFSVAEYNIPGDRIFPLPILFSFNKRKKKKKEQLYN